MREEYKVALFLKDENDYEEIVDNILLENLIMGEIVISKEDKTASIALGSSVKYNHSDEVWVTNIYMSELSSTSLYLEFSVNTVKEDEFIGHIEECLTRNKHLLEYAEVVKRLDYVTTIYEFNNETNMIDVIFGSNFTILQDKTVSQIFHEYIIEKERYCRFSDCTQFIAEELDRRYKDSDSDISDTLYSMFISPNHFREEILSVRRGESRGHQAHFVSEVILGDKPNHRIGSTLAYFGYDDDNFIRNLVLKTDELRERMITLIKREIEDLFNYGNQCPSIVNLCKEFIDIKKIEELLIGLSDRDFDSYCRLISEMDTTSITNGRILLDIELVGGNMINR